MSLSQGAEKAKRDLVVFGRKIAERGLVVGVGGNTSVRVGNIVYVKASGIAFEEAEESDYVGVDLKTGKIVEGRLKPTSEISTHLECYLVRKDVKAVVHTHPPLSTAYAMLGRQVKPFTPDLVAIIGSDIPAIRYIVPCGEKLADAIGKVIKKHNGVLMANHGLLTVGSNIKEAYWRTLLIEDAIKTIIVGKFFGKMHFFTKKEITEINNLEAEDYRRMLLKKEEQKGG